MIIKSDGEFLQYAMKNYDNPSLSCVDEFTEDVKKFVHVLSLINRYKVDGKSVNERLLLNHVIVVFNVFGSAAVEMLYYRIPEQMWPILETYLFFLKRIDRVKSKLDFDILSKLQSL